MIIVTDVRVVCTVNIGYVSVEYELPERELIPEY